MTTDEAQLVSAISMLKALGVEKDSDIEVSINGSVFLIGGRGRRGLLWTVSTFVFLALCES